MTTIDPGLVRQQKMTTPPGPAWIVSSLAACGLGGAGLAAGIVGLTEVSSDDEVGRALLPLVAGVVLLVIGIAGWAGATLREVVSHARRGEPHRFGAALGLVFILVGGGLSMLFTQVLPWAWAVLGLAVVLMVLTWLAGEGRKTEFRKQAELRASGQHTTAVVTDQGYGVFEEGTASIFTEVTVSFHDQSGTQRWVTRPKLISRHFPITNGQQVDLWYDPQHPDDTGRIVVDLG